MDNEMNDKIPLVMPKPRKDGMYWTNFNNTGWKISEWKDQKWIVK